MSGYLPLMLNRPPPLVYISPTVLFTGSDDKRDFYNVFLLSLSQYPFNVFKEKLKKLKIKIYIYVCFSCVCLSCGGVRDWSWR